MMELEPRFVVVVSGLGEDKTAWIAPDGMSKDEAEEWGKTKIYGEFVEVIRLEGLANG
jgi:hypothetical protein